MGKANGHVKRHKAYKHHVNRKRLWKKSKQMPAIACAEIKAAWDPKKNVEANMKSMGLALDANRNLKIDDTKDTMTLRSEKKRQEKQGDEVTMNDLKVADLLEYEANTSRASTLKLSEPEAQFCIAMIEKHGTDYKAMAKDATNYYQETPKQIKRKIEKFRKFPGPHVDFLKRNGLPSMETE